MQPAFPHIAAIYKTGTGLLLLLASLLLSGCSGEGFHLRGSVALPEVYQRIYIAGHVNSAFTRQLTRALQEVGSRVVKNPDKATAILQINDYKEGKRVAGYGANREVRQYLIFLHFDFETWAAPRRSPLLPARKVNLDKTQIYDSEFVLGKIEEERLIREDLRKIAARQVLLRLRYSQ